MADSLVDGEDLGVILDCLDDDQDIQDAFLTAAEEALETPVKTPGQPPPGQQQQQQPPGQPKQQPPPLQAAQPPPRQAAPSRQGPPLGRGLPREFQLPSRLHQPAAVAPSASAQAAPPKPGVQQAQRAAPPQQQQQYGAPPQQQQQQLAATAKQEVKPPVEEMARMRMHEPPSTYTRSSEKGTSGNEIPLCVNFIPIKAKQGGVFQYAVSFSPDIESRGMRHGMLKEHRSIIGSTMAFDGAILFLPKELEKITTLQSKRQTDGAMITITITYVKYLHESDRQCVQWYNNVFRRVMKILEMNQIGRHYYDPKRPTPIPQHRLELWPGYITTIQHYEGGLMLLADVSHRLLRTDTVLQFMYDLYQKKPNNFQTEVTKQLVGSVVLTRYNNKTYRIDDIAWDSNPQSKFNFHTGEQMSYVDYYKKNYGKQIDDLEQPLLMHRPKKIKGKPDRNDIVCLIPELCSMTGLTDTIRQDFRVMKDIAAHTRVTPAQRQQAMLKFIENIYSTPRAVEELSNWGLELDRQLLHTPGRALQQEKVMFGSTSITASPQADWGREVTRESVITPVHLNCWMIAFTKRDESKALDFVNTLMKCAPQMGIKVNDPIAIQVQDERTETYLKAIRGQLNPKIQVVVIVFPTSRDDRYAAVKKLCCIESPVPSQVINAKTISQANKLRSVTQKIALQINCKLGGELWALEIPMRSLMVVGIDVYHDSAKGTRSIGGFVASTNKLLTKWYSRVCFQQPGQELIDGLKLCFTAALRKFHEVNHTLPERIVVFRDGVGDGQLGVVSSYEVKQLSECFPLFGETYKPKMAVIVVQKRISMRLFAALNGNGRGPSRLENPPPGTILDHTITRKDWWVCMIFTRYQDMATSGPSCLQVVRKIASVVGARAQTMAKYVQL